VTAHGALQASEAQAPRPAAAAVVVATKALGWEPEAEIELQKIPFFVRGKARRNTERYALEQGVATITVGTLYDAKAHFGR
jgi:light-independent protochlorophyllide reductase subunit B